MNHYPEIREGKGAYFAHIYNDAYVSDGGGESFQAYADSMSDAAIAAYNMYWEIHRND